MTASNLLYTLALQHVNRIGDITAKKLIAHCGSAKAVFNENPQHLLKINGIGKLMVNEFTKTDHLKAAEAELKYIDLNKIKCFYFEDSNYPETLKQCIDAPILLFGKGNIMLKNQPLLSVVGTRKITSKGIDFCKQLIETLSIYNPIIVSGFAYGTDITAQKAALKHNLQTIGCLAHSFNQMYPKVHKKYVSDIEMYGGFFTDFWSTSDFNRKNFLRRNRIIAGLSEATIVIESAEKGGSLVTADIANSYDRDVFAVPGKPNDMQSVGCNNLIKQHKAHLLSHPLDVPYILNWKLQSTVKPATQKPLTVALSLEEETIYNYLKTTNRQLLDTIALACKLPTYKVASLLLEMELKGVIKPLPGKQFEVV